VTVASPALQLLFSGGAGSQAEWAADSRTFRMRRVERGYTSESLEEVTAATGAVRTLVAESASELDLPIVNSYGMGNVGSRVLGGTEEVIWPSERDGWMHYFLCDTSLGAVRPVRQLTSGEWVVRGIEHLDEKNRVLFFTAGGREIDGRDPYLRHLYRVCLDEDDDGGRPVSLLTPEAADHRVSFSPDGQTFVDCFSRPDLPTRAVLRCSATGRVMLELELASTEPLTAGGMGWVRQSLEG